MELVSTNDEVANKARGEVEIVLKGRTLKMRPTHQFLAEIESLRGMGVMAIVQRFLTRNYGFADVVDIVWAGLKAGGLQVRRDKVAELVFETGITAPASAAIELLSNALGFADAKTDDNDAEGDDGPEGEGDAANG